MSERTSHKPGTFCWVDLSTSDADAAKAFYGALFGWEFEDMPVGEGMTYTMARKQGKDVAALSQGDEPAALEQLRLRRATRRTPRARRRRTAAPCWRPRSTSSTPAAWPSCRTRRARSSPSGSRKAHIGAALVNETGAFTWNDLSTPNIGQAASFYEGWIGWRTEEIPGAPGGFRVIYNDDRTNGSISPALEGAPPFWCPYFGVDDLEPAAAKVEELGGRKLAGPIEVPQGAFSVVADPQGAVFALWGGSYDD